MHEDSCLITEEDGRRMEFYYLYEAEMGVRGYVWADALRKACVNTSRRKRENVRMSNVLF